MFNFLLHRNDNAETQPASQALQPSEDQTLPLRVEVARHIPLMQVLNKQIRDTAQQVEQAVVDVCSTFQHIAEEANHGVSRATEFLSRHDHRAQDTPGIDELIERSRQTFDSLLSTLDKEAEVSEQAIELMREIDTYADKISNALKQIEDIAEGNRMLALNARIEAARAGELGKGFEVVASEVVRQANRSQEVVLDVSQTIHELQRSVSSALMNLSEMGRKGQASAEQERHQVEETLSSFNTLDRKMREMLEQSSKDGENLSAAIGKAINRMQFQDRVNQRLDHVALALNDSQERLASLCGDANSSDCTLMDEILERYTMHEEREVANLHQSESASGEVELF